MKVSLSDVSVICESSLAKSNWSTWKLRHEPTGIEEDMDWKGFESALKHLVLSVERNEEKI